MSSKKYPSWQRMISFDTPGVILERHQRILERREVSPSECELRSLEPTQGLEKRKGYGCNYELHWSSYKGWQCYMEHTGCFAIEFGEED